MPDPILCDLCSRPIPPNAHYHVRIDVYADPSMPELSAEEIASLDLNQAMKDLLKEMEGMSPEELQDQVHRRFEYRICRPCQLSFLANPLGKPRGQRIGHN